MKIAQEIQEKAYTAETHVAAVRLAIIVLNILVFLFLLPKETTIPWLGHTVSAVALVYAVAVFTLRPQHRFPVMQTSVFTSISDASLITLWILATGGFGSPFYVLWYASIAAIALRYDARTTLATSVGYVVAYTGLLAALGAVHHENLAALVVRNAYTVFIGILRAWLAHETLAQSRARRDMTRMAERLDREVQDQTRTLLGREDELRTSLRDLETANHKLKELDRLKTTFVNTTAHELRTPLTSLKLQLHMLKTEKLGALNTRQQRATDLLDRNMQRLALLIDDVSDAAKLQGSHFRITPVPIELRPVLDEVYDTIHEAARQRGIRMSCEVPDDLWVRADAHRLSQVVFNLFSNALKFTKDHGRIRVSCHKEQDQVTLSVADDGAGMTADQIDRLFRPFSQVHDTMQSSSSGTGLGLYISKGIIEHHGGAIWCESAGPGEGTTFRFVLPLILPATALPQLPEPFATLGD